MLPLITVGLAWVPSISKALVLLIPPPSPAALFPEMVLLWIWTCGSPEPAPKIRSPPDVPLPAPLSCVAELFFTWEFDIDMRA